jgi:Mlc titration factor MtfA (ptsG expression regulator)
VRSLPAFAYELRPEQLLVSARNVAWAVTLSVLLAPAVLLVLRPLLRRRRRRRLAGPLPAPWRALLYGACPLYRRMPPPLRSRVESLTRIFLDEIAFVGCGGLEVTLEMKLMIAFQACLLIVEHGIGTYDALGSVLVYPDQFLVEEHIEDESGIVTPRRQPLSGQAISTARVVLSWADVRAGGRGGYNVVLHEFAHHLDHVLDRSLSAPAPGSWQTLLQREYDALCATVDAGETTLIDPYATEAPAEFFAVATELFFELPLELTLRHPALYRALARLYALDPAEWRVN